jgi:thioredoxin-related protein
VDGLEAEWEGRASVVRLNVQTADAQPVLDTLQFRFTPTFILFNAAGKEVWRTNGFIDAAEANAQLDALTP